MFARRTQFAPQERGAGTRVVNVNLFFFPPPTTTTTTIISRASRGWRRKTVVFARLVHACVHCGARHKTCARARSFQGHTSSPRYGGPPSAAVGLMKAAGRSPAGFLRSVIVDRGVCWMLPSHRVSRVFLVLIIIIIIIIVVIGRRGPRSFFFFLSFLTATIVDSDKMVPSVLCVCVRQRGIIIKYEIRTRKSRGRIFRLIYITFLPSIRLCYRHIRLGDAARRPFA